LINSRVQHMRRSLLSSTRQFARLFSTKSQYKLPRKQWVKATTLTIVGTIGTYFLMQNVFEEFKLIAEESITKPLQPTISQKEQHQKFIERTNELQQPTKPGDKPRLVILGTGWGAMAVAEDIDPNLYDIVIISPRNYFLFTPMLPSTAVGTIEMRSVLEPIRRYLKRKLPKAQYFEAKCTDVDHESKTIKCTWEESSTNFKGTVTEFEVKYDYLVLAVGAHVNTFNTPGVVQYCHFMKEIKHARDIRTKMMDLLEAASLPGTTEDELRQLLHFVIVGGGPTGVEFSGELRDFLHNEVEDLFPKLFPYMRITLIQSADHILNSMDLKISEAAENKFKLEHINVVTLARVVAVGEKELTIFDKGSNSTKFVPYGLCVWTTGIKQIPLIEKFVATIPSQKNNKAVLTDPRLRVKGTDGSVFAIGDCSTVDRPRLLNNIVNLFKEADTNHDGVLSLDEIIAMFNTYELEYPQLTIYKHKLLNLFKTYDVTGDNQLDQNEFKAMLEEVDKNITTYPQTAQVASKEGRYLAKFLNELQKRKKKSPTKSENDLMSNYPPFTFKSQGAFAYIGGYESVAEIEGQTSSGFWTWFLYRSVYLSKQVSWKNKFCLATDWTKSLLFGRDISRF
jgi:NADH dehydrogenase FAD-containing subunit